MKTIGEAMSELKRLAQWCLLQQHDPGGVARLEALGRTLEEAQRAFECSRDDITFLFMLSGLTWREAMARTLHRKPLETAEQAGGGA